MKEKLRKSKRISPLYSLLGKSVGFLSKEKLSGQNVHAAIRYSPKSSDAAARKVGRTPQGLRGKES